MKEEFKQAAAPDTIALPRRWPEWERPDGKLTGAMGPDTRVETLSPEAIECLAFARAGDSVVGYRAVFVIAEGVDAFVTFLKPDEEQRLRDAVKPRNLLAVDAANGTVQPGFINSFEHPESILLDPARITRIIDAPRSRNDFILFDVVFGKSQALPVCARDADFDSEAVIDKSEIFAKYRETAQEKFFREADEGTLLSQAMDARRDRHREILNGFARDLAARAPQLHEIDNTKYVYFTRPGDIEDVFVYLQQTDTARLTYNKSAGEKYDMPVMEEVHFKTPADAVAGAEILRRKSAASAALGPSFKQKPSGPE